MDPKHALTVLSRLASRKADQTVLLEKGLERLVDCLAGLDAALHATGRIQETLPGLRQLIARLREILGKRGSRYDEIDLADSLSSLGSVLCELGRQRSTLAPLREAIEIYRCRSRALGACVAERTKRT